MAFLRKKEDFVCEHCGAVVVGSGYTNHCPECLWSKHVDIEPGDRAATCGGLMEPVAVSCVADRYRMTHRCIICGYEKINDSVPEDHFDALLSVVQQINKDIVQG